MNKIILIISLSGSIIGGAQKRYLSLFKYTCGKRKDYYLVINRKLYLTLKRNNILGSFDNVRVMTLFGEGKIKTDGENPVFTAEKSQKNREKKTSGTRIFLGRNKMFLKYLMTWITFAFKFRKILKELKSRVVYSVWTGGIFACPLKKFFRFRLIHSYNDYLIQDIDRDYWKFFDSEYYVLRYCDKIDFLSPAIVRSLEKEIGKIDTGRICVTPNSFINYENFTPEYPKENSVIFLSRLKEIKNPMLYLQSVKLLSERFKGFSRVKFFIYGEGPLEYDIKAFIADRGFDNVCFGGPVYDTWKYLGKSKVFLSLQKGNNYPSQSLIEAMACENAVVASDVGETRRLITENEGILVSLDAEEISRALEKLFTTPGLIEKLGKAARKKVTEEQTIEKFADYFYSITDTNS